MSKSDSNEQIDADILQSKADVLRARDVIPPFDKETRQKPKQADDKKPAAADKIVEIPSKKKKAEKGEKVDSDNISVKADSQETGPVKKSVAASRRAQDEPKTEIPQFDLAKELMARQRKATATRRKAPGSAIKPQKPQSQPKPAGAVSETYERLRPTEPERERIIADIVARDIKKLSGNGNS